MEAIVAGVPSRRIAPLVLLVWLDPPDELDELHDERINPRAARRTTQTFLGPPLLPPANTASLPSIRAETIVGYLGCQQLAGFTGSCYPAVTRMTRLPRSWFVGGGGRESNPPSW
jgi:hypothetical protein